VILEKVVDLFNDCSKGTDDLQFHLLPGNLYSYTHCKKRAKESKPRPADPYYPISQAILSKVPQESQKADTTVSFVVVQLSFTEI
jgi:predicted membrane GTPase involved in stress response